MGKALPPLADHWIQSIVDKLDPTNDEAVATVRKRLEVAAKRRLLTPEQLARATARLPTVPRRATAPPQPDMVAQLTQLAELHAKGVLTDAEFAAAKSKLLA